MEQTDGRGDHALPIGDESRRRSVDPELVQVRGDWEGVGGEGRGGEGRGEIGDESRRGSADPERVQVRGWVGRGEREGRGGRGDRG